MNLQEILKLISDNAEGVSDASGKTELDSYIEAREADGARELPDLLREALPLLDEHEWKQWRAFRQITGRLKLKPDSLRNELAIMTESGRPSDSRARFYAYLARADLSDAAPMDELLDDTNLRSERPGDWLQLALAQTSPSRFRAEALKLADGLKATDFAFKLSPLREKYGEQFIDWMTELCLAMHFQEGIELANLIDEEYSSGIHSELLARHPKLRATAAAPAAPEIHVPEIWDGLHPEFKAGILEKA